VFNTTFKNISGTTFVAENGVHLVFLLAFILHSGLRGEYLNVNSLRCTANGRTTVDKLSYIHYMILSTFRNVLTHYLYVSVKIVK
jgi:hypothetical protein